MRHLTNTYNPDEKDAKMKLVLEFGQTVEQAWSDHMAYLNDKIIGRPKATERFTVAELEAMGMVGVYAAD